MVKRCLVEGKHVRTLIAICLLALAACTSAPQPQEVDTAPAPPSMVAPSTTQPPAEEIHQGGFVAFVNGEVPAGLGCPEYGSRAAEGVPSEVDVVESHAGKIIAMGGSAKVHIRPDVVFSGDIVICGGGATLIAEGQFMGNVHVSGGGARVVLVDRNPAAPGPSSVSKIYLTGGDPELVSCNERANYSGARSCRDVF